MAKVENKVLAKVNGVISVEECVSKEGNVYKALFATVNGLKFRIGFFNDYIELNLLKAGVKIPD